MPSVTLTDLPTFEAFLEALSGAASIRLVKLNDYGFTAPREKNGAILIQPMVRLVATAFDKKANVIYRWQEEKEARQMVSISAGTGRGQHAEMATMTEKERIRQLLQLEGFSVEQGEWTPAAVDILLGRTGS